MNNGHEHSGDADDLPEESGIRIKDGKVEYLDTDFPRAVPPDEDDDWLEHDWLEHD